MNKNKFSISLMGSMIVLALTIGVIMYLSGYTNADVFMDNSESSELIEPSNDVRILYSTENKTNESVTATFVSANKDIKVTNNDGNNTFVFSENGKFVFEYIDESTGKSGYIEAKVDWIDKVVPTAYIEYDYSSWTNRNVKASLIPSENIIVLNNNDKITDDHGNIIDNDPYEFIFNENGEFTFEYVDLAGNKGSTTAKVDWIDKTVPKATLKYDITNRTELPVKVEVTFDEENVLILNNENKNYYVFNENGEFLFEYVDKAGNVGSINAYVDWIISKKEIKPNIRKPVQKTNSTDVEESEEVKYKTMTSSNIEWKIDEKLISENITLVKNKLKMSANLIDRFNENCEYFEIYFENEEKEKVEIEDDNSVLNISLDSSKKFKNIYMINENEKVQIVNFEPVEDNKIQIKNAVAGHYLIEYEKVNIENIILDDERDESSDTLNAAIVVCASVVGVVLLMSLLCVLIKSY